jgi:dsRNA-specific ribonuclease
MAQLFVRNVYERHVDWVELVQNDDNYKNILQVKIQKEFKTTPHYMEFIDGNEEDGKYHMGVYLCLGQDTYGLTHEHSVSLEQLSIKHYSQVHEYAASHGGKMFLFLGQGRHSIKKKAEQWAGQMALLSLQDF